SIAGRLGGCPATRQSASFPARSGFHPSQCRGHPVQYTSRFWLQERQVLRSFRLSISLVSLGALAVAGSVAEASSKAAAVTQQRMENAGKDGGQWMSYGRTWDEQRFSPLTQINDKNVKRLGLAWYADLNTYRGVDATPLVIDGVLYNVSAWSIATAYDAASGKVLWTYDPKVPLAYR